MTTYYTEQRLETELGYNSATASQWQATNYIPPMSFLETVHLPSPLGALTTIPGGPYATSVDVSGGGYERLMQERSTNSMLIGAVVLIAAFYIFLPQRV